MFNGVRSAVVLLGPPDQGPFTPAAVWPNPAFNVKHLVPTAERALKERRGLLVKSDAIEDGGHPLPETVQIAYPIEVSGKLHGVVVLEADQRSAYDIQSIMRQIHWGSAWPEILCRRAEAAKAVETHERLQGVLDFVASVVEQSKFQAAAMAFVTRLATKLDCDRVSLGFEHRNRLRVSALSHSAEFGRQMNLVRGIAAAMEEAMDQRAVIVYPPPSEVTPLATRAHAELARQHGAGTVCTIPLRCEERYLGGLTLERPTGSPFDSETVELCETVAALVAPVLDAKRREERWLISKARESFALQLGKLVGPGHLGLKLFAAAALALTLFFCFAKGEYRVTALTSLEGTIQRAISAPFNGYITEAGACAGDVVKQGDRLCLLDERDLKLERLKWSSEREQLVKQYREAMAKHDRPQMQIINAKIDQAEAQLSLVDEQLSRAKVVAPFHGVVTKGDLRQSLGAPVERGQVLFEMAPLESYRVIVQVDERDIAEIAVGQRGELLLPSIPGEGFPLVVEKITPVSTAKEGRNYFRVEARLEGSSGRLRPGMEGIGKISIDRRKLIWIWAHELVDWLSLKLWAWWP